MRFSSVCKKPSAQRLLGLFTCILLFVSLVNSNPVRKAKRVSSNSSSVSAVAVLPLSRSLESVQKPDNNTYHLKNSRVKSARKQGKQSGQGLVIAMPDVDLRKGSSSTERESQSLTRNSSTEKVGRLPRQQQVLLPPLDVIVNRDGHVKAAMPDARVPGVYSKSREEQGAAVGVGAMNRDVPASNKSVQIHHQGPDSLLDVGAADRKKPKTTELPQGDDADRQNEDIPNPALQQPPPQEREPPLNQIREKEAQFAPIKPQQGRVMSGPNESQENAERQRKAGRDASNDILKYDKHVVRMVKTPVELAELNPPDHVEGARMEKDGHLNRDYKKEIFLGHHEEFEWTDEEKVSARLKNIFRRANINGDRFLDEGEIQKWIADNIRAHLHDAAQDNAKVFHHLDADKDGFVSWSEFYTHFLIAKGYIISAKDSLPNITLEIEDNERIMKYRYRWSEANTDPEGDKLDVRDMMNFRHPEQSGRMISELIKDLINNLDRNGDAVISEKEFVALPHDLNGDPPLPMEENWQEERKKEFQNVIDLDKDGFADKDELKIYFDPHNMNHARLEAQNLIKLADNDDDGKLTIEEVLDNTDLFVGSKMVDPKRKLHDEF